MSRWIKRACFCAATFLASLPAHAAIPAAVPLITAAISDADTIPVQGELSSMVARSQDLGRVPDAMSLPQLMLVLKRPAARQAALDRLVADQLTRGSPSFQKWLSPEELFPSFGPASEDIARLTGWLANRGFTVQRVSADGMTITFAGTARQAEESFHTEIHTLSHHNEMHFANIREPAMPRAFAAVVAGITLHDFFPKPMNEPAGKATLDPATGKWKLTAPSPDFITPKTPYGTFQAIGANDFTTIYNVNPLRNGNGITGGPLTGAGATIVLLNDGDADPRDWDSYRRVFLLSGYKGKFSIEHPGNCGDPGIDEDSVEAALDIDVGSMSAPDANVILATCPSESFNTNSGLFTALQNLVTYGTPAQIVSVSYGFCEAGYGPTALQAWSMTAEEAAAEGLSIFVATGDNGSAGCDDPNSQADAILGTAVNGLASNPYVTAVGGTDFSDFITSSITGKTDPYFAAQNGPGLESALSYVPEIVWNDSCASPEVLKYLTAKKVTTATSPLDFCNTTFGQRTLNIVGGGGGRSAVYAKPDWQSLAVPGMPNDKLRDLPDVSMFASSGFWEHFTIFCGSFTQGGTKPCNYDTGNGVLGDAIGGTSVATPSFAGIMLLENQYMAVQQGKTKPIRIGNVAPRLYALAAAQFSTGLGLSSCNSSLGNKIGSACVFHNVTKNSNAVPCAAGSPNCYTANTTQQYGVLSTTPGPGTQAYLAHSGYSLANGLGSVDAFHLIIAY